MNMPKSIYLMNANSINTDHSQGGSIWDLTWGEKWIINLKENILALVQGESRYEISGTPNTEYFY